LLLGIVIVKVYEVHIADILGGHLLGGNRESLC
jgi:hypothetical protein